MSLPEDIKDDTLGVWGSWGGLRLLKAGDDNSKIYHPAISRLPL